MISHTVVQKKDCSKRFVIDVIDQKSEITVRINGGAYISILKSNGSFHINLDGIREQGLVAEVIE